MCWIYVSNNDFNILIKQLIFIYEININLETFNVSIENKCIKYSIQSNYFH